MITLTKYKQPEQIIKQLPLSLKEYVLIDESNQSAFIRMFNTYKGKLPNEIQDYPILYKKFYEKFLWIIPTKVALQIILTRTSLIVDCRNERKVYVYDLDGLQFICTSNKTIIKGTLVGQSFKNEKHTQITLERGKFDNLKKIISIIKSLKEKGEWFVESSPFIKNWKSESELDHYLDALRERATLMGKEALRGSSRIGADRVSELDLYTIDSKFPNILKALEINYQQGFELALDEFKEEVEHNGGKCFTAYKDPEEYFQEYISNVNPYILDVINKKFIKEWFFDGYDEQIEMLGEKSYELGFQHGYKGYYTSSYSLQFNCLITDLREQPRSKTLISLIKSEFDHGYEVGAREKKEDEKERKITDAEWEARDQELEAELAEERTRRNI